MFSYHRRKKRTSKKKTRPALSSLPATPAAPSFFRFAAISPSSPSPQQKLTTSPSSSLLLTKRTQDWIDSPFVGQGSPPNGTTKVYLSVYLDRLISLNEQQYTFAISLYFFLSWVDPRCAAMMMSRRRRRRKEGFGLILFFRSLAGSPLKKNTRQNKNRRQGPRHRRQRHRRRRPPRPRAGLPQILLRAAHEHAGDALLRW